jgi:hypothetical protein
LGALILEEGAGGLETPEEGGEGSAAPFFRKESIRVWSTSKRHFSDDGICCELEWKCARAIQRRTYDKTEGLRVETTCDFF